MYDHETEVAAACFDPNNNNNNIIATSIEQNSFLHETNNNSSNNNNNNNNSFQEQIDTSSMGVEFQNNNHNNNNDLNNWTTTNIHNVSHEIVYPNFDENIHTSTTDLLTLLHLPRCSFPSSSSNETVMNMNMNMMHHDNVSGSVSGGLSTISYDPASAATIPYDPLFHLNLPPQPSPLLRDLMFQSLPHGYNTSNGIIPTRVNDNGNGNGNGNFTSLFGNMDENNGEGMMNNGMYTTTTTQDGSEHIIMNNNNTNNNAMFEFSRGANCLDDAKLGNKGPKSFATERQRRQDFNDKFHKLRELIPSPTKMDRASIVHDAIGYINELKRSVEELKLLVEQKRISKERLKTEDDDDNNNNNNNNNSPSDTNGDHTRLGLDGSGYVKPDPDEAYVGSSAIQLRSSWLQRKCKDTEVDVRIVDDEVTIKLVQRKKMINWIYDMLLVVMLVITIAIFLIPRYA